MVKSYEKLKLNQKNDKKWYFTYTIKFFDGTTRYDKVYGGEYDIRMNDFTTSKERDEKVEKLKKELIKDLDKGIDPKNRVAKKIEQIQDEAEKAKGVTYQEAFDFMVKHHNWINPNPSSVLTAHTNKIFFNAAFRKFVESIGKDDDITKVTTEDIADWILRKNRAKEWDITTCTTTIGKISYIFSPLVELKKIAVSPTQGVNVRKKLKALPKKDKKNRFEIWKDSEVEEFISVGQSDKKYALDFIIGFTCYHAFIRRSEMLRLTLGMVNLEMKRFEIPSDITKSARIYDSVKIIYLPIKPELVEALSKYIKQRFDNDLNPDYYLFPSIRKNDVEYDYYQYDKDYKKRLGAALNNDKANYSLKHTGVTKYYYEQSAKGVSISAIINKLKVKCRHQNALQTLDYLNGDLGLNVDEESDD
jgi:integrase